MTGPVGLLLIAVVLAGATLGSFAWRVTRVDPSHPQRLVGELRLAQMTAIFYAATGAVWIGLAIGADANVLANVDVTLGVMAVVVGALSLQLEPRAALLTLSIAFVVHALLDIAHRPGMLSPTLAPQRFIVGCAVFDVYLAAICFWARGR